MVSDETLMSDLRDAVGLLVAVVAKLHILEMYPDDKEKAQLGLELVKLSDVLSGPMSEKTRNMLETRVDYLYEHRPPSDAKPAF